MNFTLKTLVAAVALVAAGSANAYQGGATGNGNLVFVLADTTTNNFMLYALPSAINDFVPASGSSIANVQATGVNTTFDLTSSAAFQSFSAASTNTANWSWSVVALDNTPGTPAGITGVGQRRYLTTLNNTQATPVVSSSQFGSLNTAQIDINLNATTNEFYSGSGDFVGVLGDTWKTNVTQGIGNAYGQSSSFFYLTGKTQVAYSSAIVDTTGAAAQWTFGAGNVLAFTTSVAAVPESDTYAMLLAGLGVMGLVARRRLAA